MTLVSSFDSVRQALAFAEAIAGDGDGPCAVVDVLPNGAGLLVAIADHDSTTIFNMAERDLPEGGRKQ